MKIFKVSLLTSFFCLILLPSIAFSVTLTLDDNGYLTGAEGVNVMGDHYNVNFQYGNFSSIFGDAATITTNGGFIFQDENHGYAAAFALLEQVFTGIYDVDPMLTAGATNPDEFMINTVYGIVGPNGVNIAYTMNRTGVSDGYSHTGGAPGDLEWDMVGQYSTSLDSVLNYEVFYAVWAPAPVPEPATLLLFGFGLVGINYINRKRKISPIN